MKLKLINGSVFLESDTKLTKNDLRDIIKEEKKKILKEYELYVDKEGNVRDDEGNVERRGRDFGRRYGGQTYGGTRPPWGSSRGPASGNIDKMVAVGDALQISPNNKFLKSIHSQLIDGRSLSSKQTAIVKKILRGIKPELAKVFEGKIMKITLKELRLLIREAVYDQESGVVTKSGPLQSRVDAFVEELVHNAVTDQDAGEYMDAPAIAKHWKKYVGPSLGRAYPDVHSWMHTMDEKNRSGIIQAMMAELEISPYV
jgi:hypothetical protein